MSEMVHGNICIWSKVPSSISRSITDCLHEAITFLADDKVFCTNKTASFFITYATKLLKEAKQI